MLISSIKIFSNSGKTKNKTVVVLTLSHILHSLAPDSMALNEKLIYFYVFQLNTILQSTYVISLSNC